MAYVISGRLRLCMGNEAETTAEPGAMVFVPRGVARTFTADLDDTRVYRGFIPAGFEAMTLECGVKTDLLSGALESPHIDAATAKRFGVGLPDA